MNTVPLKPLGVGYGVFDLFVCLFVFLLETGSHTSQVVLELDIYLRMKLGSFSLLPSVRVRGARYHL